MALLVISIFLAVFLVASRKTYSYSGILPQRIRRGWVKWRYPEDYSKWPEFEPELNNTIHFYKLLDRKSKSEFLVRTTDFMNRTSFEGRDGVEIDDRKRLLLAATMAQITYGFSQFRFWGIQKIILYPRVFYSKFLDTDVKGLTYGTGFIFLSWQDFEEGYADGTDKLNLGLHEFAHALMLEKPRHFETETFDTFLKMGNYLMQQKQESGESDTLFRDYGLTNHSELWAVCVEVFFEKPMEFFDTYPNLYRVLTDLLQLDMVKIHQAYQSGATFSEG